MFTELNMAMWFVLAVLMLLPMVAVTAMIKRKIEPAIMFI